MRITLVILLLLSWSTPAKAEVPAKDYSRVRKAEWFKVYVDGVGRGYTWANVELKSEGRTPLFCQPAKLILEAESFLTILDRMMSSNADGRGIPMDIPIELLLLTGLRETFPCAGSAAK